MKKWLLHNRSTLILSILLYFIFQSFYYFGGEKGQFYSWFALYLGLFLFSYTLPDWKFIRPIIVLVQVPMIFLHLIKPISQALLMLMCLLLFSYGLLAILLSFFPEYPFNLDVNFASKLYILLIAGSMILTLWGPRAIYWLNSILNSGRTEQREKSQLNFTLSLINKNKIRFFIYIGFLFYLIPYSIVLLSNANLFTIENVDKAVFNAFISYTAFERVLTNMELMKIDWVLFFKKLLEAIK